jgi:hypothetical protein
VKASSKLGSGPSVGAITRLQSLTSPPHSGGLEIVPSIALFDVLFVSTMALKVSEEAHFLTVSSPTLESHPSSP